MVSVHNQTDTKLYQVGKEIQDRKLHQFGAEIGKTKLHQVGGETENLKLQQSVREFQNSKMHQPGAEFEQLKEHMELLQKEMRETKRLMKANNRRTTGCEAKSLHREYPVDIRRSQCSARVSEKHRTPYSGR